MKRRSFQVFAGGLAALTVCTVLPAQCREFDKLAPDGGPIPTYGNQIAVDGSWAAIAASQDDLRNPGSRPRYVLADIPTGAVYIRHFVNDRWETTQRLRCPHPNPYGQDEFGYSIAMQGDTLLVGAPNQEGNDGLLGVVFVYTRDNLTWNLVDELQISADLRHASLGWTVALDGDVAAIGAIGVDSSQGAVFVFERIDGVWEEAAQLQAGNGRTGDHLGSAIALQDHTILAGARDANDGWGSAWIFEYVDGDWIQVAQLAPGNAAPGDQFGLNVCLDGDEAWVSGQRSRKGRIYVFERRFGAWQEVEAYSFTSYDGVEDNHGFGQNVVIEGDVALISAPEDRTHPDSGTGSVYYFHRFPDRWVEGPKIYPQDSHIGDQFADAIDLEDGIAFCRNQTREHYGNDTAVVDLFDIPGCRPVLSVIANCPDGGPALLRWKNATPHGRIQIFFAASEGRATLPPGHPCAGTVLNLEAGTVELIYQGTAGASGNDSLWWRVEPEACGGVVQLLDLTTCVTSNTAHIE